MTLYWEAAKLNRADTERKKRLEAAEASKSINPNTLVGMTNLGFIIDSMMNPKFYLQDKS